MPLVGEDHAHRNENNDEQERRVEADPAQRGQAVAAEQPEAGDPEHQQAEADGQRVALVRGGGQGLGLDGVHERQDEQVEHAAAEHVADRDVGQRRQRRGAEAGEQLRQAGGRRQQDHADPAAPEAGLLAEDVAVPGQAGASQHNHDRRAQELQPDHRRPPPRRARHQAARDTLSASAQASSAPPNTMAHSSFGMCAPPRSSAVKGSHAAVS